jgi:hypothetical protein
MPNISRNRRQRTADLAGVGFVFTADHGAVIGAPAEVEIGTSGFPDEGFFDFDRLMDGERGQCVGVFEGDDVLVEELGRFVAGGEDDAAAGDGWAVFCKEPYAVGGG